MNLPLVLAPEAEDDLLDAADWYDAQQPGLGDAFLRSVDASFARIGRFPQSFPANDRDIRSALLRRFPYAVLFRIRQTRGGRDLARSTRSGRLAGTAVTFRGMTRAFASQQPGEHLHEGAQPFCAQYSSTLILPSSSDPHGCSFPEDSPGHRQGSVFSPGSIESRMVRAVITLWISILRSTRALFRSREHQAIVELALRQQLAVYARRHPSPRLSPLDRTFWIALSRLWPWWKSVLVVVRPETVIRWHQRCFRSHWRSISIRGPGRPALAERTRHLITRMATENRWRARKIQAELSKLGIRVSLATISRYLPRTQPDPGQRQRWTTFLRNHRDLIAGMDFFVVPTVRFQLLYVWFAIDHGRRRILHFNVTASPASSWVIQQLRSAFPNEPSHRFLILDNDAIFSAELAGSIGGLGLAPTRTSFRSPWQNGTAERFVGSVRRELLDHVVVLGEGHLRRLLREYVEYYNAERVHTSIGDAPAGRESESQPSPSAKLTALPRVGGLHHRYTWRAAA